MEDRHRPNLVFAIVGVGGRGKTTLARKIHDDQWTRNAFSTILWVYVSKDFTENELLSAIIRAAGGNPKGSQSRAQLETMLARVIEGRRFLLVLDDVWSGHIYEELLETPLRGSAHGSRIVVTTRDEGVAIQMNAAYIHNVHKLAFQDCWTLLCRSASLDEKHEGQTLREVGIRIIQRCNTLPLAVRITGGVLRTKEPIQNEWLRVSESEAWSLKDHPEGTQGVMGAIFLSYNGLPSHLKQCFLYCSLFPVGFVIKGHFITQLWISQGFIETRENCTPEEVAEECYRELVSRSLLQPVHGVHDGTRCTMHDRVHSFAHFLTKGEIFAGKLNHTSDLSVGLRHLSIANMGLTAFPKEIGRLTSLRTLLLSKNPLHDRGLEEIFKRFTKLRVLDLAGTEIKHIPRTLGNLVHLRQLNLSLTRITDLPESIEDLKNLHFLGLRHCHWLHSLPRGIQKLHNLTNLDLRGTALHQVQPRLCNLGQLTVLHGFVVNQKTAYENDQSGWPMEDLKSLDKLTSLQILKLERVLDCSEAQEAALARKSRLKELELYCSTDDRQFDVLEEDARKIEGTFERLCPPECLESLKIVSYSGKLYPHWISASHLPKLQKLVLVDCMFCERLPALGQLPQLRFLTIAGSSKLRSIEQEGTSAVLVAFPKLEELHVRDLHSLESWTGFGAGDLPCLSKFRLENCPKLRSLPSGINHCTALTKMQILHADSLEVVEDLPMLKELVVQTNARLAKISKLPSLQVLYVISCTGLLDVDKVHSLSHLRIVDRQLERIPEWLARHASVLQTFTIVGTAEMLEKSLPGGADWPVIRDIAHVYANLPDESPFFSYTKSSGNFHSDRRPGKHGDPSGAAVVVADETPSISHDHSVESTSQNAALDGRANRTTRLKQTLKQHLFPVVLVILFSTQFLSFVLQKKMNGQLVVIQNLFVVLLAVVVLLSVLLD